MTIESRLLWDNGLKLADDCQITGELLFWLNRVQAINIRELASYSHSYVIIYSDVNSVAAGVHTVELDSKVFHTNWSENEKSNGSTWREMRAIEQAMLSFKDVVKGKTLKWFTDNQNCIRIVKSGSMKLDLQALARSIFTICSKKMYFQ